MAGKVAKKIICLFLSPVKFEVSLQVQMLNRVGSRTLGLISVKMWVVFKLTGTEYDGKCL